jgi:hypothetical protein
MKHPTPSDFIINVEESHVSVIFKPSNSDYNFGRLADPEDIARFGPLSSPNVRHGQDTTIHRKKSHGWRTRWLSRRSQTHNRPLQLASQSSPFLVLVFAYASIGISMAIPIT